ncbi:hypothetical protein ZWY2020_046305 [Hordeum vulgare]|nr:hypothetical protein ZWY2020_046305 [Hordeum vulgare]
MKRHTIRGLAKETKLQKVTMHLLVMWVAEVVQREKINVPYGLCVFEKAYDHGICVCCLVNRICYVSMDECKRGCGKPTTSEDIVEAEASARETMIPLPTPSLAKSN